MSITFNQGGHAIRGDNPTLDEQTALLKRLVAEHGDLSAWEELPQIILGPDDWWGVKGSLKE